MCASSRPPIGRSRRSRGRALSQGPLLPAAGGRNHVAAAARTQGGHRRPGGALHRHLAPSLGVAPFEISDAEMGYLQQYDWPGNVRELRNLIERSLIVGALNVSALYQRLGSPRPPRPRDAAADRSARARKAAHLAVLDRCRRRQDARRAAARHLAPHARAPRRRMGAHDRCSRMKRLGRRRCATSCSRWRCCRCWWCCRCWSVPCWSWATAPSTAC